MEIERLCIKFNVSDANRKAPILPQIPFSCKYMEKMIDAFLTFYYLWIQTVRGIEFIV